MSFVLNVFKVNIIYVKDVGVSVMVRTPIVLWQDPLIEIINDEVWIDDLMVWKKGEYTGVKRE